MQTLVFNVDKQTDINLLTSLAERIGVHPLEMWYSEAIRILSDKKLRIEISIILYQNEKISLGKASELCGLHRIEFQKILAERKIPINYGIEELEKDLKNLAQL